MEVKIIYVSYSNENIRLAQNIAKKYGFKGLYLKYLAGTNVENIITEISSSRSAKWVVICPSYYESPFDSERHQCPHLRVEMSEYDLIMTLARTPAEYGTKATNTEFAALRQQAEPPNGTTPAFFVKQNIANHTISFVTLSDEGYFVETFSTVTLAIESREPLQ